MKKPLKNDEKKLLTGFAIGFGCLIFFFVLPQFMSEDVFYEIGRFFGIFIIGVGCCLPALFAWKKNRNRTTIYVWLIIGLAVFSLFVLGNYWSAKYEEEMRELPNDVRH